MMRTVLCDFVVNDVLGNLTATVLLSAGAWVVRKIRSLRTARRDRSSAD
ncbi:hypothetical protein [Streptomyces sp. NPDC056632]